jgi:DNA segregation ATPase FtsK/SpoIIIE, S-DNA-T family
MADKARSRRPHVGSVMVHVPLSAVVLAWMGRWLAACVSVMLRRLWPVILAGLVAGLAWTVLSWSRTAVLLMLAAAVAFAVAWRVLHGDSFRRLLGRPGRGWWRRVRVYRPGWAAGMALCGLRVKLDGAVHLPVLVRVRSDSTIDELTVRMLPGQVQDDYAAVADRLAQTFGAIDARVRSDVAQPNQVQLWLLRRDPLARPVTAMPVDEPPDLCGLPLGLREDGQVYRHRLLGSHLLLVGATGAGKSSVVWSLVQAVAPGIAEGAVAVWVVDPKGGMELAGGRPLFARFCDGDPGVADDASAHEHAYADLLDEAVSVMRTRQARLRGSARLHEPTTAEPLVVLVIDELASLTAYVTDRDAKKRISRNLSVLLSQGRAVGVLVVAALQDPRKEVLPARDLFPTRVALRLTEAEQVDMVLGDGARNRGARCERIPESLPGVGYVALDGVAEPVRVRFAYLSDAGIADLCARYGRSQGQNHSAALPRGEVA